MSEPIHLVVTLQVKPGHMDRLKQATAELVAASRQEAGCVSYGAAYAEDGVTAYTDHDNDRINQRFHKDRIFKHPNIIIKSDKSKGGHRIVKKTSNKTHNHRCQDKYREKYQNWS